MNFITYSKLQKNTLNTLNTKTMSREFKNEVLWRVTVNVNGKQEYSINETNYDQLCDKLTDIMIRETL